MIDKILLFPYYAVLRLRHYLYDTGRKKSSKAALPTIVVGNITVGGTGKTPHTEMILRILNAAGIKAGVLSGGYGRKSKGFVEVGVDSTVAQAGDEPLQIKRNFPSNIVCVDKDRLEGCTALKEMGAEVAVLDDAFQHRKLIPSLAIVLVDWYRPIFKDHLLPLGRLRDLPSRIKAADAVIVSKCPEFILPEERKDFEKGLASLTEGKEMKIFYTAMEYSPLETVFPQGEIRYKYSSRAVVVTGIANDAPLLDYLSQSITILGHLKFADHHDFSSSDISRIEALSAQYPSAAVITTQKDAQRLLSCAGISDSLKSRLLYQPIRPCFLFPEQQEDFKQLLLLR